MKNYKDMTTEEIKEQLEWSDQHEFSYGYSIWAFEEIERLNNIINEAKIFLKSIGYDEETGRIWNDMNDDECTDLLKILEGGRE